MQIPEAIVAVLDLEWTAWEGSRARRWSGPGEHREIVQVGCVRLDTRQGLAEIGHFEVLVRPRINPQLSDYFVNLTGLDQARIDAEGLDFAAALAALRSFVGDDVATVYSYGADGGVIGENCRLYGLDNPFPPKLFASVGPFLAESLGRAEGTFSSADLPRLLGFPSSGVAHTALSDARAIAEALRRLTLARPATP